MILVAGARGLLGSAVVERLAARGAEVVAGGRDIEFPVPAGVGRVRLDVRDRDSVVAALSGVRTVVAAIHGLAPPSRSNHPGVVDGVGVRTLIDESVAAGVEHLVYVSAKGAAPDAPSRFFRLKHAAEEHLRASGLDWTIIRPAAFIEVHGLQMMGEPLRGEKPVRLVGQASTPIEWVAVRDVADLVVRCIEDPACRSSVIEVAGPGRASRVEALAMMEAAMGRSARRSHLPRPVASVVQRVGGAVNPGIGYLLETALAEDRPPGHPRDADETVTATTTLEAVVAEWAAAESAPA